MKKGYVTASFIVFGLALTACDSKSEDSKKSDEKPKTEKQQEEQEEDEGNTSFGDMPFEDFYKKFTTDESFQMSRIYFPLVKKYNDFDDDNGKLVEFQESIEQDQWNFFGFTNQEIAEDVKFTVVPAGFNVIVEMRGTDNGVSVDYIFEELDGKWMLVGIEDHSM
jgi:hypothetical protein